MSPLWSLSLISILVYIFLCLFLSISPCLYFSLFMFFFVFRFPSELCGGKLVFSFTATFLCLFTRTRTILANWSSMVKPKKLAQPRLPLAHLQTQEDCAKCPDCTLCSMQNPTGFRSQSLLSLLCGWLALGSVIHISSTLKSESWLSCR